MAVPDLRYNLKLTKQFKILSQLNVNIMRTGLGILANIINLSKLIPYILTHLC
jgi:hypothetical protein